MNTSILYSSLWIFSCSKVHIRVWWIRHFWDPYLRVGLGDKTIQIVWKLSAFFLLSVFLDYYIVSTQEYMEDGYTVCTSITGTTLIIISMMVKYTWILNILVETGMAGIGSLTQNIESKCYCRLHLEYDQAITSQWVKAPCVDKPIGLRSKNLLASIPSCSVFGECTSASNPIPYSLPRCYVISMCTSYFSDFADRFLFACAAHITTIPYAWQLYSFSSRQRLGCTLCSSSHVSLVSLHRHWREDQSACDTSLCMWHHTVPLGS